jgi:hypothetical protein
MQQVLIFMYFYMDIHTPILTIQKIVAKNYGVLKKMTLKETLNTDRHKRSQCPSTFQT